VGVLYLIYVNCVEWHCAIGLLGFLCEGTETTHSIRSHGCDGSPSLLPQDVGSINIVGIRARPPFAESGALHGLDDEKAEAHSMPRFILGVGSEQSLQFSFMV
jgi:hypothetical protein